MKVIVSFIGDTFVYEETTFTLTVSDPCDTTTIDKDSSTINDMTTPALADQTT
jgi:hypothetical protein